MVRRFSSIAVLGILTIAATAAAVFAQGGAAGFPDHPIRVIVPVPAGGGVDTISRLVTGKMRDTLGQPLIIDNKPGVGGSVGAESVFNSAPDGYTILASQPSPITTNPFLYKSLNYDPTQLVPIVIMSHVPNVLLVRADLPAKNVQEFIAYVKANPGKLNYASQGIGTTSHLTAELFQTLTHTKLTHVPYKGTAPAVADLLAGNVDLMFNELATSIELHKAGRARILAVTTKQRIASLPDIPTLDEAGVPGCVSDTWHALTAPP
jgi:tripartite-type tricarboxylate transporter receptor subunit TctC